MLAWFAAAVSLWLGARRQPSAFARGYRWLAGAAALYCAGLITQQVLGSALSPGAGLSFADLPPLLAVAAAAVGIVMLTTAEKESSGGRPSAGQGERRGQPARSSDHRTGPARAGRRLRHGRRPARDRLGHAVQRGVPPVRRAARHLPARPHPPAGRPGRARRAAAHGHHRLAAGHAALPGPARRPGRGQPWPWASGPWAGTPASRPSCWPWSPRCCSARPRGGWPRRAGPAGPRARRPPPPSSPR